MVTHRNSLTSLPPHVRHDDCVILFDGLCKLCNGWANFIITHENAHQFKLCGVQSPEGQQILAHFDYPNDIFDTMLYVEGARASARSRAFLRIMRRLGWQWSRVMLAAIIPKPIRDWLYDRIALNHYALFGKYQTCRLPTPEDERRYLSVDVVS